MKIIFDEKNGLEADVPDKWCNVSGCMWLPMVDLPFPILMGLQVRTEDGSVFNWVMSPETARDFATNVLKLADEADSSEIVLTEVESDGHVSP